MKQRKEIDENEKPLVQKRRTFRTLGTDVKVYFKFLITNNIS